MTAPNSVPEPVPCWQIKRNHHITPAPGVLTLTGHAPMLTTVVSPPVGALTLTGHAPTVSVVPSQLVFTDTFNRANGGLGANWTDRAGSGNITINGNKAVTNTAGRVAVSWNSDLNTDTQQVEVDSTGLFSTSDEINLHLRSSTGNTVWLSAVANSQWEICTGTAWGVSGTTRATSSSTNLSINNATIKFTASGNVYRGYREGVEVVTWTDSGAVHPTGSGQRMVGLGLRAPGGGYTNRGVDTWEARDF